MKVFEVEDYYREAFIVPNLDHKAIVFYGPPLPKYKEAIFSVVAWVAIGHDEQVAIVDAKSVSDEVEPLVEQAKAELVQKVAEALKPAS